MGCTSRRERERQLREAEIVAAAEKIFYQKGYNDASMDEIAEAAEFTKRTVYQYFSNKKELYFAVACKGYQLLLEYLQPVRQTENNGFQKMRLFIFAYYQFYQDFPHTFRLLKYCPFIGVDGEENPYHQKVEHLKTYMVQMLVDTIEEGKSDTSIRHDLDSEKGAYSIVYFTVGFFYRLSEVGKLSEVSTALKNDQTLGQEEFIRFALELLSDTLAPA